MKYWLIKSEPETYSLEDLIREDIGRWDGVRNYQARNNLKAMQLGDLCFFYRSVHKPAIQAICKVVKEHYPDPTSDSDAWVCVNIQYESTLSREVSLAEVKTNPALENMALLKLSRLSVQAVTVDEFDEILKISETVRES
jgi:predicted RNA-binding protein with PUA-like domain